MTPGSSESSADETRGHFFFAVWGNLLAGNGHRPFRRTHKNAHRTPANPHDLPTCHSEERSDVGISWNIVQIRTTYQEIAPQAFPSVTSAFGLAMTWKIEPGPSFGGSVRTPREGCPYGASKICHPSKREHVIANQCAHWCGNLRNRAESTIGSPSKIEGIAPQAFPSVTTSLRSSQ